jgi:hypothetical protein
MRFEQPKTYSISLTGWGFWLGSLAVAALLTGLGLGWLMVGLVAQALEGSHFFCPSCGEPLFVADGYFYRQTPPGTIDVESGEESSWELPS